MRIWRTPKAKWIVLLASIAVGLLGIEGVARWRGLYTDPWNPPPPQTINPYGPNPYLVYCRPFLYFHIPRSVYTIRTQDFSCRYEINARGFRGPDVSDQPPSGWKRLLLIGDSFTEGGGVDFAQGFASLAAPARRRLGWETVGVGIQGGSPIYYLANLPRYFALRPDAAAIILYDNDILDDFGRERDYETYRVLHDPERLIRGEPAPRPPISHAWALLHDRLRPAPALMAQSDIEALYRRRKAEGRTPQAALPFPPEDGVPEEQWPHFWERTQAYLDGIATRLNEQHVNLLVAHLSAEYRASGAPASRRRHADMFERSLAEWAERRGVAFFSFRDALAAELAVPGRPAILFPIDPHLNERGHRVVADALEKRLGDWLGTSGQPSAEPSE